MPTSSNSQYCVVIHSIGSASPNEVGAVAKGLGLSAEATIRSVYRAPSILAERLEKKVASQLVGMLAKLGFDSSVSDDAERHLAPKALFDVVVRIERAEHTLAVAEEVGRFCGVSLPEAMQMLATPPGLVLGGVSKASTEALGQRLIPLGAKVIASRPHQARYDLFATGLPEQLMRRLRTELGQEFDHGDGIFAPDLPYSEADRLWRTYGRSGQVRFVDRSFQHFEIILESIEADGDDSARAETLKELFGIPESAYPRIAETSEIVLGENCDYPRIEHDIAILAEVGIRARAELATFAQKAISVDEDSSSLAQDVLSAFGIECQNSSGPIVTPPLPLVMARAIHAIVRAAGGKALYAQADHG